MARLVVVTFLAFVAGCGPRQSRECAQYLACINAISPGSSLTYEQMYGENGTCWEKTGIAKDCTTACVDGRKVLAMGLGHDLAECK